MPRGRKPDGAEARSTGVHVRLTPAGLAAIDQARGRQSRSAFMREATVLHIRHLAALTRKAHP